MGGGYVGGGSVGGGGGAGGEVGGWYEVMRRMLLRRAKAAELLGAEAVVWQMLKPAAWSSTSWRGMESAVDSRPP